MSERSHGCGLVLALSGVVLLSVITLAGLSWWGRWQSYQEMMGESARRVARYRLLIESRSDLEQLSRQMGGKIRARGYFMRAANPELLAAELQKRIKEIVTKAGGKLVSTQNLANSGDGEVRRVIVKVRMKGDVEALARVFLALENSNPVLSVEDLSVRGRRTLRGRRKNRVEGYDLDATFKVIGHMGGKAS